MLCGHCTHICPVLKQREPRTEPAVFAVWNRDDAARQASTAGGVFSALAEYVLEGGGVVFGAALDDPAPCDPRGGEKHPRAAPPAGRQAGAERHRRDVPAGAALSGSGPPGAVFRHTMSGGRPVPLSGGASGASCDLRCGVQRRVQPRGVGQTGELHGLRQAAPPCGGGILRQAQRRSGTALPRPVRGRRPLRCTGPQVGAGPRPDPRPVPAACLLPLSLRRARTAPAT